MARPQTKENLMIAAKENFEKLNTLISKMSDKELTTPFDFSKDEKKKEAHWKRDKNLRDILIHLYEWHQLILNWVNSNQNGEEKPFIPKPYNWKTYGNLNVEFAASEIFFFQSGDCLVECCLVEVLRLRQSERLEIFFDDVVLQDFRTADIERSDGGTFDDGQQELSVRGFNAYVVEEPSRVQAFDDFPAAAVVVGIADFYGQVVEYGTRFGTLQAFDTDVLDGKVGKCQRRYAQDHQCGSNLFQFHHKFLVVRYAFRRHNET